MDPLTALSLAGNIIQFVDFGYKIFSSSRELYTSKNGVLTGAEELEYVTLDLRATMSNLSRGDSFGKEFDRVCEDAVKVADELLGRLDGLKVEGKFRGWNSFRQAVMIAFSGDEINDLKTRLSDLSKTVDTHLLVSLR